MWDGVDGADGTICTLQVRQPAGTGAMAGTHHHINNGAPVAGIFGIDR